jgi:hypothetical protein
VTYRAALADLVAAVRRPGEGKADLIAAVHAADLLLAPAVDPEPTVAALLIAHRIEGRVEARMSEREWQALILRCAKAAGWQVNHVRKAPPVEGRQFTPTTAAGWPDLTLVHPTWRLLVFLEVKGPRTPQTAEQRVWIAALGAVPGVVALFARPRDADVVLPLVLEGRIPE